MAPGKPLRLVEVLGDAKGTLEWAVERRDGEHPLAVAEAVFVSLTLFCQVSSGKSVHQDVLAEVNLSYQEVKCGGNSDVPHRYPFSDALVAPATETAIGRKVSTINSYRD